MYCNSCGRELAPDSRFCNRCGVPQSAGQAPAAPAAVPALAPAPAASLPEQEVWRGRPSGKAMAGSWLAWIVWTTFLATLRIFVLQSWEKWINYALAGAVALPALWILVRTAGAKLSVRYRLTTHRLFVERGVIARTITEIELFRVDDVSVSQGILDRIFGIGTVSLAASDVDTPKLDLVAVERPVEVKERIRECVRAARARTINIQNV